MTAMGRPSRFDPTLCEQAHNYCLLGATNDDLSEFFGVSPRTVDRWIAEPADFGEAVKRGRIVADSRVARGLYDRAVGYDRMVERSAVVGGKLVPLTSTVHYPPNVQACIFWLRNRRRETWGDRGSDRAPVSANDSYDPFAELEAASERARHMPIPSRGEVP
jgi:hypothetical protein